MTATKEARREADSHLVFDVGGAAKAVERGSKVEIIYTHTTRKFRLLGHVTNPKKSPSTSTGK
jgi:hypothetical protein